MRRFEVNEFGEIREVKVGTPKTAPSRVQLPAPKASKLAFDWGALIAVAVTALTGIGVLVYLFLQ